MEEIADTNVDSIRKALEGSPERRSEAIRELSELDEYSRRTVQELAGPLSKALRAESNAFTERQGYAVLEEMAEEYPVSLSECIPILVEEMVEIADALDSANEPTSNPKFSTCRDIVTTVAPSLDGYIDIEVSVLTDLLTDSDAGPEFRSAVYTLLGCAGSEDAVEELLDAYEWEVPAIRSDIESALELACTVVIESIVGDGRLPRKEAVALVDYLYDSANENLPVSNEQLREAWPGLVTDIDSETVDETAQLLTVFSLASEEIDDEIWRSLLDIQQKSPTESRAEVMATYARERNKELESAIDLMPTEDEFELVSEWPTGFSTANKRAIAGLYDPVTAPIAEVCLQREIRDGSDVPLALIHLPGTDFRTTLREILRPARKPDPDTEYFAKHESVLYQKVTAAEEDVRSTAMGLAEYLLRWDSDIATQILTHSFNRVESSGPEAAIQWWNLLERGSVDASNALYKILNQRDRVALYRNVTAADEDVRSAAVGITKQLLEWDGEIATEILNDSFDRIETNRTEVEDQLWELLDHATRVSSSRLLEVVTQRSRCLAERQPPDSKRVLELVSESLKRTDEIPPGLGPKVLELLRSDDDRVARAAIDAVGGLGFYPPPPALEQLLENAPRDIRAAADETRDYLNDSTRQLGYRRRVQSGDLGISPFSTDDDTLYLKRLRDDGIWEDVDLNEFREGIVRETLERVGRGENVPLVYPYFEEEEIVLLTVAVVLSRPAEDRDVVLYSPGSQTQWGMKGEIRDELDRYGLAESEGPVVSAKPLPEVVPHGYVSGGQVKNKSSGTGSGRIVLTKDIGDVEDIDRAEIGVMNLVSRTKEDLASRFEEIEADNPETAFVNAYSYYVRNDRDGRPRYGPPSGLESVQTIPGSSLVDSVLEESRDQSPDAEEISDSWRTGLDDVLQLAESGTVRIEKVDAPEVEQILEQLFEESATLRGVDDYGAGSLIFSRQLFFERLPVTVEEFDEWVRDRYYSGERFLPPLVTNRIDDVRQKANTVENLQAVQPLNRAARQLEKLAEILSTSNPMTDRIEQYVEEAIESDQTIALPSESSKHAEILRDVLLDRGVVRQSELDGSPVSVVSPDDARGIDHHDRLLICGPLHSENSGFYVLPRVDEVVVLTYEPRWAGMVEDQAEDFVEKLNAVVGTRGYQPYAPPEVVGDTQPEVSEPDTAEPATGQGEDVERFVSPETSQTTGSGSASTERSKAELLREAMDSASSDEYREESGRYERETRTYEIETEDGTLLEVTNHTQFLRKRSTGDSDSDYHWVGPDMLAEGDQFVRVPDEIEREMWREHLRATYSDELDVDVATVALREWYESLQQIWFQVEAELRDEGSEEPTDTAVAQEIHRRMKREDGEFDRVEGTVMSWFSSVLEASRPLELAERPELTIGPRNRRDIEVIGRTFDIEELADDVDEIADAMRGLRTIHRQEGHQYRELILESMNAEETTEVQKVATEYTVRSIEDTTDD